MRALPVALLALLASCQGAPKSRAIVRGIVTPDSWPLREITLPAGSQVEAFKPATGAPTKDVESYTAFFTYPEKPDEVFQHFEGQASKLGMAEVERQEVDPGGPQDARRFDWVSPDKKWNLSVRYWKSVQPYPYQIIIASYEEPPKS